MAAPLSAGLKNWHWRQKQVDKWAYDWFKAELPKVSSSAEGGIEFKVTSVQTIEGDVTVGQRKSKLVTIYDLDLTIAWTATTSDGTELSGTVRVPEVSHEAIDGISDYVFDFSSPQTSSPTYVAVKKSLPPVLKEVFTRFQQTLIDVHGKDLLAVDSEPASASTSGTSTPSGAAPITLATKAVEEKNTAATKAGAKINTSTVKVNGRFQISATDLWDLLTNENKIPTWSRSAAQFSPTPNAPFSLFAGAVQGSIESATKPNQLVSSWALKSSPSWPKDHYGTLTVTLEQGSDSTDATFTLTGVPKGQEKEVESNLYAFYVRGFVSMGLVSGSSSPTTFVAPAPSKRSTALSSTKKKPTKSTKAAGGPPDSGFPVLGAVVVSSLVVCLGVIVARSLAAE